MTSHMRKDLFASFTKERKETRFDCSVRGVKKIDKLTDDLFVCDTIKFRGHRKKMMKTRSLRDIKKHSFSHECVDIWNA